MLLKEVADEEDLSRPTERIRPKTSDGMSYVVCIRISEKLHRTCLSTLLTCLLCAVRLYMAYTIKEI
jgi:hypothetical protein